MDYTATPVCGLYQPLRAPLAGRQAECDATAKVLPA